jgi:GNAT superfamily N-acetyltransferase
MGTVDTRDLAARLLAELPDEPRWIETRAILRSPHGQLFAGPVVDEGVVVRWVHDAMSAVAVVGRPAASALAAALDGTTPMTPVVAQPENAADVAQRLAEIGSPDGAEWRRERMLFHTLTAVPALPPLPRGVTIRLLTGSDSLDHLPPGLRHEMSHARAMTATGAAFVDGVAASFCYPCFSTETLWDVSIDTLEEYRGRRIAAHLVRFMIDHLRRDRLEPTWGALESNTSSLRLAAKLGFTPAAATVVFARGPWAYLTLGYTG